MGDSAPLPPPAAQDGSNENTPLIHPDEEQEKKLRAVQAKVNCPVHTLFLIVVLAILLLSMDHPGIADKVSEDKHCQPLVTWLTVYIGLSALSLLVSLAFIWYCCFDLMQCLSTVITVSQLGVFAWGIVVVLQTSMGKCDQLLFWTIAVIVLIGPLVSCCFLLMFMAFAVGFGAAVMMKEPKGPEATPDLAQAAEEAKVVKGNVTAECPVCQQKKLVQFASPCGHMLCEDCRGQMQSMEDRALGLYKCPTCRQPVHFYQGVYTVEKQPSADPAEPV